MSLPRFDPWLSRTSPGMRPYRAYRAYCAYPGANLDTLGTIGTRAGTNFYENVDDEVRNWLQLLTLASTTTSRLGLPSRSAGLIASAIDLCLSPWAKRLVEFGWEEHDLFTVDRSEGQTGGLIQRLQDGRIRFATFQRVYFEIGSTALVCARQRSGLYALPRIWDLPFEKVTG